MGVAEQLRCSVIVSYCKEQIVLAAVGYIIGWANGESMKIATPVRCIDDDENMHQVISGCLKPQGCVILTASMLKILALVCSKVQLRQPPVVYARRPPPGQATQATHMLQGVVRFFGVTTSSRLSRAAGACCIAVLWSLLLMSPADFFEWEN